MYVCLSIAVYVCLSVYDCLSLCLSLPGSVQGQHPDCHPRARGTHSQKANALAYLLYKATMEL